MTKLTEIEKIANEYKNDVKLIDDALNRVRSRKSRWLNKKGRADYDQVLSEILAEEQMLKEAKSLCKPRKKFVTEYDQSDIDLLDYDETMKAIKTIQSKTCNTAWLTSTYGDNDEFRNAKRIEQMLLEHKKQVRPIDETTIRKTDLVTIIETIEANQLSQERIVEILRGLL